MLVKAKWNVKDASGWHSAGEVFETENDLGDAVEVLEEKKSGPVKAVKEPEPEPVKEEIKEEVKEEKPKASPSRRKKVSE